MPLRYRLMTAATALLYLGPLLAGLAGHGWAEASVFIALFLLWLMILRPDAWSGESRVRLASRIAGQVLLVCACFAIGRGLGGVTALRPDLPTLLPLAVSFLAIPLSRLIRSRSGADPLLDAALHRLASSPAEHRALAALNRAEVEALATRLLSLPPDTPDAVLRDHLRRLPAEDQASLQQVLARRIAPQPA